VELFEILFILFFIMIPVLEGLRKGRQRRDSPDIEAPGRAQQRPPVPAPGLPRYPQQPADEPDEAAEMIPDDLWEILTGERRERTPASGTPPEEVAVEVDVEENEPWPDEPIWEPEEDPRFQERFDPTPWRGGHGGPEEAPVPFQPEEALIVPEERIPRASRPPRISLRTVVEAPPAQRTVSPLMESLKHPEGLRQAVLLKEILGPPKGLDP
jgi:hypothetical protein